MANNPNNPQGNPMPEGNAPIIPAAAAAGHQAVPPQPRNRRPRRADAHNAPTSTDAQAIFELAALCPLRTVQRDSPNTYIPDCQMMFHVLGICDQLMVPTERFTQSTPAWLPIVSQIYVSTLWITHIMKVQSNAGIGSRFRSLLSDLIDGLHLNECMIPGPLVPFFQAVTATNGHYDWSGDIVPVFPPFRAFWNNADSSIRQDFARLVPFPALMLDQLVRFSRTVPQNGLLPYDTFLWYNEVFGLPFANLSRSYHLGPQLCGSLHSSRSQFSSAHRFWSNRLRNFDLIDLTEDHFGGYLHFLGITSIADDTAQTSWFLQVSLAMQNYCRYFQGSTTLGSISTTGIGASAIYGTPTAARAVNYWYYPKRARIAPFSSAQIEALRPIPPTLQVTFRHADTQVEEQAEYYAILTHTNIDWSTLVNRSTSLNNVDITHIRSGRYWTALFHRTSNPVNIVDQFQQYISAVYHRRTAQDED